MTIHLTLPYAPTVNSYWGFHGARRFVATRGVAFRYAVAKIVDKLRLEPLTGRLNVYIEVYPPDNRIRDLDNLGKSTLDSLTYSKLYIDDSQIDKLTLERKPKFAGGKLELTIEVISD